MLLGNELYFTTEVRKLILEAPRKLRAAQTNNVSSHAFPGLLSKDYMPSTLLSPVMRFRRNKRHALCPHESYLPKRQHFEQELIREVLSTQLFGIDFQFSGNSEKEAIRDHWEEMESKQIQGQM